MGSPTNFDHADAVTGELVKPAAEQAVESFLRNFRGFRAAPRSGQAAKETKEQSLVQVSTRPLQGADAWPNEPERAAAFDRFRERTPLLLSYTPMPAKQGTMDLSAGGVDRTYQRDLEAVVQRSERSMLPILKAARGYTRELIALDRASVEADPSDDRMRRLFNADVVAHHALGEAHDRLANRLGLEVRPRLQYDGPIDLEQTHPDDARRAILLSGRDVVSEASEFRGRALALSGEAARLPPSVYRNLATTWREAAAEGSFTQEQAEILRKIRATRSEVALERLPSTTLAGWVAQDLDRFATYREPRAGSAYVRVDLDHGGFQQGVARADGFVVVKEGEWQTLDRDGRLRNTATYLSGYLDGASTDFSAVGRKTRVSLFANGVRDGEFTAFNQQGQVIAQATFQDGHLTLIRDAEQIAAQRYETKTKRTTAMR